MTTCSGIQFYTEVCHEVQSHTKECRGTWLFAVVYDVAQWDFGAFPQEKSPGRDVRHSIGFDLPRINEDIDVHLGGIILSRDKSSMELLVGPR